MCAVYRVAGHELHTAAHGYRPADVGAMQAGSPSSAGRGRTHTPLYSVVCGLGVRLVASWQIPVRVSRDVDAADNLFLNNSSDRLTVPCLCRPVGGPLFFKK